MFAGDQKAAWPRLANAASDYSQGGWRIAMEAGATNGQRVAVVARTWAVGTDAEARLCEQSKNERCVVRPAKAATYLWPRWLQARDHCCRLYTEHLASCNGNEQDREA